mmetsp:Transcript_23697/g.50716  ORF Transcript_23697/g.50716 Transcript_23697/m.50716 type:complete len:366 (+) Transcript_23697:80-1177(+)
MTKFAEDTTNKTEVTFLSSDPSCGLWGDLTLPSSHDGDESESEKMPAIVIVAGSGPIDRNGNAPSLRLNLHTSDRFSDHVSRRRPERAIAVLSYDKRGVGKSQPVPKDKNFYYRAGMMDLVGDAVEAVRFAAGHPRIDKSRIVLLGHSEGAIILPLICREVSKDDDLDPISGCIFYSGFGETLLDAMSLQRETLLREVKEKTGPTGWVLRRVLTREKLEKQHDDFLKKVNGEDEPEFVTMHCGLVKQPAKWLREHIEYNVEGALEKHVTCHCLAITGQKDFQVRNEFCDAERAATLVPNAKSIEAHRPENLTHVLRSTEGPSRILEAKGEYAKMGKMPLDAELLEITDVWCDRVLFEERHNAPEQ